MVSLKASAQLETIYFNLMKSAAFSRKKISQVRDSNTKLSLIRLQNDGKGYSTVKQ